MGRNVNGILTIKVKTAWCAMKKLKLAGLPLDRRSTIYHKLPYRIKPAKPMVTKRWEQRWAEVNFQGKRTLNITAVFNVQKLRVWRTWYLIKCSEESALENDQFPKG
jgi:hypothetical protein